MRSTPPRRRPAPSPWPALTYPAYPTYPNAEQFGFSFEPRTLSPVEAEAELRRREAALRPVATRRVFRVLSYGGGVDSFCMLVDAIQRNDLPDLVVFADVTDRARTDPGEWPQTYRHIEQVVIPLCAKHGIPFKWLHTDEIPIRKSRSLYAYLRSKNAMVGRVSRLCTTAAKVERVVQYLDQIHPHGPIEVWIGFEAGEESRAAKDPHATGTHQRGKKAKPSTRIAAHLARRTSRFPMIERRLCRCRAVELIRNAGFPVPPGSACTFCPFSSKGDFQRLQRQEPGTFVAVAALEASAKLTKKGETIRFAGGAKSPTLEEWVKKNYKPRTMKCKVCGNPNRIRKNVGCETGEG